MKARMIYLATLMMGMFIMSACTNEDDFSDITDSKNLLTESIEIFEVDTKKSAAKCPDEDLRKGKLYCCFEKESELEGLYMLDDMYLLNWSNRTLVMVDIFYPSSFIDFTKKVYEKDGKYVIELLEIEHSGFRDLASDHKCYGILLDKANVKAKNIHLKVGIYLGAGTDSEGNKHEKHYEYLK